MKKNENKKTDTIVIKQPKLSASNLQQALWETLQDLKSDKVSASTANSIAGQVRGIISITRLQLQVTKLAGKAPNKQVTGFIN